MEVEGSVRPVGGWAAVEAGDSIERVRSGLGEAKMEAEHIAAELHQA